MFIAFIATAMVTVLPLGCFSYYQLRKNLMDQEIQNVREQIWQANMMLDGRIAQYLSVITSLLYNEQIRQCINREGLSYFQQYLMFTDFMEPTIENIIGSHSDIIRLKIFTDNRTLKGHSRYLYDLETMPGYGRVENRPVLQYQMTDEILTATAPFPDSGTKIQNILHLEIRISDVLSLMTQGEKKLALYDESGDIVFASVGIGMPDLESMEGRDSGIRLGNRDYLVFSNDISQTGWTSVCLMPKDTLAIGDFSILHATALVLLVAVFVCMLMSSLLCKALLGPMEKLKENIGRIQDGDFGMEISSEAKDEIGQFTNAFGEMTKRLNRLVNEVYRSQILQKEAQFKMLQAQLNPHFLYNSLSFINWSALRVGAKDVAKISRDISNFYRTALNGGNATTKLAEEILNAKSYVNIQLALHHDSFDVVYEVEEACREYEVICNLLQPLIENALEHGIDKKRDGRGKLRILAYREGGEVVLAVTDNGPGFACGTEKEILCKESGGYGLKNVNDRIRIFYGENYGLTLCSGEETRIEARLPAAGC